jgi:hypothetical protein
VLLAVPTLPTIEMWKPDGRSGSDITAPLGLNRRLTKEPCVTPSATFVQTGYFE